MKETLQGLLLSLVDSSSEKGVVIREERLGFAYRLVITSEKPERVFFNSELASAPGAFIGALEALSIPYRYENRSYQIGGVQSDPSKMGKNQILEGGIAKWMQDKTPVSCIIEGKNRQTHKIEREDVGKLINQFAKSDDTSVEQVMARFERTLSDMKEKGRIQ